MLRKVNMWTILFIVVIFAAGTGHAQECKNGPEPAIEVILSLDQPVYNLGDPIYATLSLLNTSNGEIITSSSFSGSDFFLFLQFYYDDGKERKLITSDTLSSISAPTPPPPRVHPVTIILPDDDGTIVRSELPQGDAIEYLPADWKVTFGTQTPLFDVREYYPLAGKNGNFTVQAVIDMRTYAPEVIKTTLEGIEYAPLSPEDTALWCGTRQSNLVNFNIVGDRDGDGYAYPGPDCDDDNAAINPGAVDDSNNGIDEDCNPATPVAEAPPAPGFIQVQADKHTVGGGSRPGSSKEGIKVLMRVYDKSQGSCAATNYGISWQHYPSIWAGCGQTWVSDGTTGEDGAALIKVPPGNYLMIGVYDEDGSLFATPPAYSGDEIYIGRSVGEVTSGQTVEKYLQVIVKANGKKAPGKYKRRTGSDLLIIEPEYVEWDGTEELYPFIFESVGDWEITTAVAPPEGFVADHDNLSEEVTSEIEAVQFVITDIGSEWIATGVVHDVTHKGKKEKIKSKIGVKLSKKLAKQKGLDIYGKKMKKAKKKKKK